MLNKIYLLLLLAAAYLLSFGSASELQITNTQLPCNWLPTNVVPSEYQLKLLFPTLKTETYHGQVDISVRFGHKRDQQNKEKLFTLLENDTCKLDQLGTNTIVLHADSSIDLQEIEVSSSSCGFSCLGFGDEGEKKRTIRSVKRDVDKQLIAIKLSRAIKSGSTGTISIKFEGRMRQDKRGVYLSEFSPNGRREFNPNAKREFHHIVSHFQPTGARLVFPLFDEPRFKARFRLRLVHPQGLTALSNSAVQTEQHVDGLWKSRDLISTTFMRTPPMPAHMLAFVVGEFDKPLEAIVEGTLGNRPYTVRLFTAPELRESARFALEVAQRSLENFERYIDFEFPLEKLDLVAIADHETDNTESWGLSFLRDSLVWIDEETKPETKITTAVNVAHVCVHQWMGNLISVAWWNDLWITEGVAGQFAFNIVRELYPELQSEYFVRLATLTEVMQLDATRDEHPLAPALHDLRSSGNVFEIFDNLEFMKSAALAQMVSNWLSSEHSDWYREALRKLISSHAYKSFTREDYFKAIKFSALENFYSPERDADFEHKLADMINSFVATRGVSLVNTVHNGDRVRIDLELMNSSARKDISSPVVQSQSMSHLFAVYDDILLEYKDHDKSQSSTIKPQLEPPLAGFWSNRVWSLLDANIDYVKVSPQPNIHTYFRTRYSDNVYDALRGPISRRELSPMDRLQLLDDANVLVQAQLIKNDTFKQLIEAYANEDNGAVLLELMRATETLASLTTNNDGNNNNSRKSPASNAILMNLFTKFGFTVSKRETLLEQRARSVALKALIEQGNQQVIEAAIKTYEESDEGAGSNVALFLRDPVYTAIVLQGNSQQVAQLLVKMKETKSYEEKLRLASALALSTDRKLLRDLWIWLNFYTGIKRDIRRPLNDVIEPKAAIQN